MPRRRKSGARRSSARADAALAAFSALLLADRWLFEAGEAAEKGGFRSTRSEVENIRVSVARSLSRLQAQAYAGMRGHGISQLSGPLQRNLISSEAGVKVVDDVRGSQES